MYMYYFYIYICVCAFEYWYLNSVSVLPFQMHYKNNYELNSFVSCLWDINTDHNTVSDRFNSVKEVYK